MSAPVLWIVIPVVTSAFLLFLVRYPSLLKIIGIVISLTLALTAIVQPIGNVLHLGSISIDITPVLYIFGRSLLLENADRFTLSLIYTTLLIYMLALDVKSVPAKFVPLSLAITGLLIAALAVQPFLYSALLVELAVLLTILMVKEKTQLPEPGIIRFLIYLSLAMPCIMFAGWILGGNQASVSDASRLLSAVVFLLIGFSIWLAVFPFHSWLPQFSQAVHPYLFGFLFSLFPVISLLIIMDYISSLLWLRSAAYLTPALMVVGVIMVVTTGILSSVDKDLKRLLAYTVLLETGFSLLVLSIRSAQAVQLLYQSFIPRIFSLGLLSFSISVCSNHGFSLTTIGVRGIGKKLPFATIGVLVALFSITGFPLFAGFPVRFELLTRLGQSFASTLIWIAVGLAAFLVGVVKLFMTMTTPDREKREINEKISEIVIISIGVLILILIGFYPQLTALMIKPFISDIPVLW